MYSFDGQTRIVTLDFGVTSFNVQDFYSRWKEWVILSDNSKWSQAMLAIGGEPLGGGQFISAYIILLNGWKLRPYEANHSLTVLGNLSTDDESPAFIPTLGNFNVIIREQVTSNSITTLIETAAGSGGSYRSDLDMNIDINQYTVSIEENRTNLDFHNSLDSTILTDVLDISLKNSLELNLRCH